MRLGARDILSSIRPSFHLPEPPPSNNTPGSPGAIHEIGARRTRLQSIRAMGRSRVRGASARQYAPAQGVCVWVTQSRSTVGRLTALLATHARVVVVNYDHIHVIFFRVFCFMITIIGRKSSVMKSQPPSTPSPSPSTSWMTPPEHRWKQQRLH